MSEPIEPQLNHFPVLRYDRGDLGNEDGGNGSSSTQLDPQVGRADMDVSGLGSVNGPSPIHQFRPLTDPQQSPQTKPMTPQDEVEISEVGRMLDPSNSTSEVRAERLAQIKAAIEEGTYETPDKMEAALGRLLEEIDPSPELDETQ